MKMVSRQEKVQSILWFHESMSLIAVQRHFRGQYGRQPLCINSIKQWYNKFRTTYWKFCGFGAFKVDRRLQMKQLKPSESVTLVELYSKNLKSSWITS